MKNFIARPFYIIEPHPAWVKPGEINITEIAGRVYGKPFNALHSIMTEFEHLPNDSVGLVEMFGGPIPDYAESIGEVDETDWYLGMDRVTKAQYYHHGHTRIEYWQSVKWLGMEGVTEADVTVTTIPLAWEDLYGAVFRTEDAAQRHTSPPIRFIIADLIRREELPQGDFIARHWW